MANDDNLKGHGFHEIAADKQREIARKGAYAAAEARRRKKAFRELIEDALQEPAGTVNGVNINAKEMITYRLVEIAKDPKTSPRVLLRAYETLRDSIGEKPVEKIQVSGADPAIVEELRAELEDYDDRGRLKTEQKTEE